MVGNFGYAGKILRVDLSSGNITHVPTMDYADRFLGGRGIAAKIYWDEVSPEVKAFDAENRLIFITGPLAGVSPGVSGIRWLVCGKSPISIPEQFSYSNFGGSWGTELKFAGYDGIVVHGKSEKPVYIFIQDGTVEIRDASELWGKSTVEVKRTLKEELGNQTRVVTTGPAGDNMAVLAIMLADNDSCGTSGFGAVMGSKNLKAITVRGSGKVAVADPEKLRELNKYALELLPEASQRSSGGSGPAILGKGKLDICRGCGLGGCRHTVFEGKNGKKGRLACMQSTFYATRAQRYYGNKEEDWGEVAFQAAMLTNEYGIDCNALQPMVMWLSRCRQAGILTDESTGIPLSKMGSMEFIETFLHKMSFREGFGDILAEGVIKAAALVGNGADKLITDYILKGGQHISYNPRFYISTGILYAMEPRQPIQQLHEMSLLLGAWVRWVNKDEGAYVSTEVYRAIAKRFFGSELAVDFSTYEGKALAATMIQDREYAKESMILCDRLWPIKSIKDSDDHVGDPSLESKVLSAVTGEEVDEEGLYRIGERVVNMQRAILVREARGSDVLPESHFTLPLRNVLGDPDAIAPGKDGEIFIKKDAILDRERFAEVTREFYQLRGWDEATGLQTKAKLEELELGDIAEGLMQRGLLASR
jgi:aldehyde:ferredoxin oxidoreductase